MTPPIVRIEAEDAKEKLPDQIADAWAAVLIDIYQRLKREEAKPKDGEAK